jgi:hypothetical protein
MLKLILTFGLLFLATAASGILPVNAAVDGFTAANVPRSDGTYNFYYYGSPTWQWAPDYYNYTGVNFDPTDNEGDTTYSPYEVTYVDSLWNYDPDGAYDVTLYICDDVDGVPDLDNPRYEYGPYEPQYYSTWDMHAVTPPVQFNGGQICWVVFDVSHPDCHPITDGDGNSGHSWLSGDGYTWELMAEEEGVDWCIGVYAEPGEPPDDTEAPYITDAYPVNDDWPCGVPPTEDTAGCHWQDGDPTYNVGIDVGTLIFEVRDSNGNIQAGELDVDDSDLFDVIVVFDVQGLWEEGENFAVETECYDLAGNSDSAFWIFSTGYVNIVEESFGAIKAGFAGQGGDK